jgi:gluconolactonase
MAIETLAFGYGLVEGPRVDGNDNLYFSDVRNGGVFRRSPEGVIETVIPERHGVGGIALHAEGGIVVSGKNVCHVRDGETRVLFAPANTPGFNDLYTDRWGCVYVGSMRSDPFAAGGPRTPGELWRITGESEATECYGDVGLTNGIGLSPDERLLYHADSAARQIYVSDVRGRGQVVNRRVFVRVDGVPDGLAVDSEGGVWVAMYQGGCVARYTPDGALDRTIDVPAKSVTSLCFGGEGLKDLYIVTADNTEAPERGGTVFRTRADVAGLPAPLARV